MYIVVNPYVLAGEPDYGFSVHPGIKFGYSFGENGGFLWGLNLSIISEQKSQPSYGWNFNLDFTPQATKLNAGLGIYYLGDETFIEPGLTIGPSLLTFENDKIYFGISIAVFAGTIVYPYYSYTGVINNDSISEIGYYFVYPGYNNEKPLN